MSDQFPGMYAPIEPYETGVLPVSDGHRLVFELCGNPNGKPVVFLHGGPGAGCTPAHRRFFDPEKYKIVLFDQRGAGRSTPNASVEANTTWHLVDDIETLRRHLGIRSWIVFGGSWGSTLALAYASRHPEVCRGMILRGIWHCRPADLDWWFSTTQMVYPEYWSAFAGHVSADERDDLLGAYLRRLCDPDPNVHMPAAIAWDRFESSCDRLLPPDSSDPTPLDQVLAMPRIEAYYMRHGAFLRAGELIDSVPKFRHIPAAIVHGRYDMLCPVEGAIALADAWPEATLTIVPDAGHSAWEPGILRALIGAADRFRFLDD